jgi:hypothetical protein
VAWVESRSPAFSARHDSSHTEEANRVLDRLERFRAETLRLFQRAPEGVAVVLHPRPVALTLAHPWLPLARMVSAPAGRRYFAGWFSESEIHVLTPAALEQRASAVPGSREALARAPQHEYAHIVVGANHTELPPPFSLASFRSYVRWAWLCEGAATWLAGQVAHLRPAIVRRLRDERRPDFPPAPRDAMLLGGTLFALLERLEGAAAGAYLATSPLDRGPRSLLADAFGRNAAAVERDWRAELDSLRAG